MSAPVSTGYSTRRVQVGQRARRRGRSCRTAAPRRSSRGGCTAGTRSSRRPSTAPAWSRPARGRRGEEQADPQGRPERRAAGHRVPAPRTADGLAGLGDHRVGPGRDHASGRRRAAPRGPGRSTGRARTPRSPSCGRARGCAAHVPSVRDRRSPTGSAVPVGSAVAGGLARHAGCRVRGRVGGRGPDGRSGRGVGIRVGGRPRRRRRRRSTSAASGRRGAAAPPWASASARARPRRCRPE